MMTQRSPVVCSEIVTLGTTRSPGRNNILVALKIDSCNLRSILFAGNVFVAIEKKDLHCEILKQNAVEQT